MSWKVNTGGRRVPSLFTFYINDMPRLTEPVKWVCHAVDPTVWDTGVKIPDLKDSLNSYFEEITAYQKNNSLLISANRNKPY